MKTYVKYAIVGLLMIASFTGGILLAKHKYSKYYNKYNNQIDSIEYNIKYVDSIIYDIKLKDSIIYNIKIKYKDEIEKVRSIDDTDAIKLFYSLVRE